MEERGRRGTVQTLSERPLNADLNEGGGEDNDDDENKKEKADAVSFRLQAFRKYNTYFTRI